MRRALTLVAILAATPLVACAQWTIETSNTTADLRGIHSIGGGVAWASGTNGTVLRTEDGGYVWQSCTVPQGAEKLDFRGVQAFDANTAIVMSSGPGDQSRLYKTTDGCHSWKLLLTNLHKDGFWDAVQFSDPKHGFVLGDPVEISSVSKRFELEQTYDGGEHWNLWEKISDELATPSDGYCAFAASNSSLTARNLSAIFASGCKAGARLFTVVNGHSPPGFCDCNPMPSEEQWNDDFKVTTSARGPFPASDTGGIFSVARGPDGVVAVGGDFKQPDATFEVAATWRALRPDAARHEAADADRNWNALSLPFVVGPHGRIGKLNDAALKR